MFYFILKSYSTHSPEITGLKLEIKILFICSLIFCYIQIQYNNSGSRKKFLIRIHNTGIQNDLLQIWLQLFKKSGSSYKLRIQPDLDPTTFILNML